ncbi:UDP-N-acetylmuramate dehydrogenase [Paenibacillus sp. L3-i20]|uniref:UDP-N-acetylmuramate dehydrogenase n=1 Tax=Paenibacillus sp. L3-i20 TaxID=2905833 RepID=UPI001EDFB98E|nr:UDP-N-acetylmuramate dehydrogenase [Paenibacillus sp. L3-i20]GKU77164.1 UDP-N-acetylenolpyruvoylglucosamine reductase 2 [Paenibacillus sp. L3-i20]
MNYFQVFNEIKEICPNIFMRFDERMAKHTFIQTGGPADIYIMPTNIEEVQQIARFAFTRNIPLTIIGYGSNIIIRDRGIRGIVMNFNRLNKINVTNNKIIADSGSSIIDVSRAALENHLSGLEFACGIPGSVGGAVLMNAGAYGGEISFVLKSVKALSMSGDIHILNKSDLQLGYRSSIFQKEKYIIVEVTFELENGDQDHIQELMRNNTIARESKQPLEYPSCGSVFKRPPNQFAGKLISESGLQGYRVGGAEVSVKHAGFIVNVNHASSADYLILIRHIQKTVKRKFKIDLETEVVII